MQQNLIGRKDQAEGLLLAVALVFGKAATIKRIARRVRHSNLITTSDAIDLPN